MNKRVAEEELELLIARHRAKNIDVYASEWTGVGYKQVWAWLWSLYKHGVSEYWPVNCKPNNIDEDWRLAIRCWFGQIMPSLNGLMGEYTEGTGWKAQSKYAIVYNWVVDTWKSYETESDRNHDQEAQKIVHEFIDGLKAND